MIAGLERNIRVLTDLLIDKGLLTEAEWEHAYQEAEAEEHVEAAFAPASD